jgi:hypothetical protein
MRLISREVSHEYPNLSTDEQARLIAWKLKKMQLHDQLHYRIQATRFMGRAQRKIDQIQSMGIPSSDRVDRGDDRAITTQSNNNIPGLKGGSILYNFLFIT